MINVGRLMNMSRFSLLLLRDNQTVSAFSGWGEVGREEISPPPLCTPNRRLGPLYISPFGERTFLPFNIIIIIIIPLLFSRTIFCYSSHCQIPEIDAFVTFPVELRLCHTALVEILNTVQKLQMQVLYR